MCPGCFEYLPCTVLNARIIRNGAGPTHSPFHPQEAIYQLAARSPHNKKFIAPKGIKDSFSWHKHVTYKYDSHQKWYWKKGLDCAFGALRGVRKQYFLSRTGRFSNNTMSWRNCTNHYGPQLIHISIKRALGTARGVGGGCYIFECFFN